MPDRVFFRPEYLGYDLSRIASCRSAEQFIVVAYAHCAPYPCYRPPEECFDSCVRGTTRWPEHRLRQPEVCERVTATPEPCAVPEICRHHLCLPQPASPAEQSTHAPKARWLQH